MVQPSGETRDQQAPLVIGRYALYDKVASGGMATVYVGRVLGAAGFSRTVAIKRLHANFAADPDFAAMFLDEARLAARVRHPNVVPTLDVVSENGELFLVMEYVEGESLAQLARLSASNRVAIPPDVIVAIVGGVLHGLHAAHEAKSERGEPLGIIHRDVSPQNVIVGTDGVARVLDFGVAKAASQLHTTREGQVKGKLAYLAPEQIGGKPITRQVDVFAAAVVAWELLARARLFSGETEGETLNRVLTLEVRPPSIFDSAVPLSLDDVVMRGLERDPQKRFATALDFALALEAAVPPASSHRVAEWVRSTATERIAQRAAMVSEVERSGPFLPTPAPSERSLPQPTAPPKNTRLVLALALVTAAALGISVAVVWWAVNRPANNTKPAATSAVASASVAPAASAPIASTSVATAASSVAEHAVLDAGAAAAQSASHATTHAATTTARPKPSATATASTKLYSRD